MDGKSDILPSITRFSNGNYSLKYYHSFYIFIFLMAFIIKNAIHYSNHIYQWQWKKQFYHSDTDNYILMVMKKEKLPFKM